MTTYGKRNLKLLRENVPPRLENYQAMYDKEQRPTERNQFDQLQILKQSSIKLMIFSENVLTVLVLQQEQHEE